MGQVLRPRYGRPFLLLFESGDEVGRGRIYLMLACGRGDEMMVRGIFLAFYTAPYTPFWFAFYWRKGGEEVMKDGWLGRYIYYN